MSKSEEIKSRLARISAEGTPALRDFAPWVLDNFSAVAFHSIRGLAKEAGVNPNTVTRLALELGYQGFDAFRADVQTILQNNTPTYGERARTLRAEFAGNAFAAAIAAHQKNTEVLFKPETLETLNSCIEPLLAARKVYVIGVRSCYSIAHYFSYVGGLAFANFVEVPSTPGGIVDQMSWTTPDDIVVGITYAHYSAEVVSACQIARACGARVLALTDSYSAPIAIDAWKVLQLPMAGPNFMPSLNSALLACELMLVGMAAQSDSAAARVSAFEDRIRQFGGYSA